jgi:hypothetical protein
MGQALVTRVYVTAWVCVFQIALTTRVENQIHHTGGGERRNHGNYVKAPLNFVYVVGVEGVGHHGVTPALSVIAKSCGQLVAYEPRPLRMARHDAAARAYSSILYRWGTGLHEGIPSFGTLKELRGVTVIEDQSFPTDGLHRNGSAAEMKATLEYDIEWVYSRARLATANIRFFHLTRDFYRTASSHVEFDKGFQKHALVLKDFQEHIRTEYEAIEASQPGLWRQLRYEWFTEMRNCTALASAIIDFAGWGYCDVDFACEVLHHTLRDSTKRSINEADYAFAQSLNASIPIPDLDISDSRVYNFTKVISSRSWDFYDAELRMSQGEHPATIYKEQQQRAHNRPVSDSSAPGAESAASAKYTSTVGNERRFVSRPHRTPERARRDFPRR